MAQWNKEERELLGQILPGVAGQLRAPLNNLCLAAERLFPDDNLPEAAILRQSYYRMLRLVNNLSQTPQLLENTPLPKENLDAVLFFETLCRQAEPLFAEKGVALCFVCTLRYHAVALHADNTERMVWNLLSNALKFTPKGGHVTVTLKKGGSQLLLSVTDTGCGIPADRQEDIFSRWRSGELQEGFGLGLPMSCHIAERQGGRLLLNAQENGGTVVTVSLPDETVPGIELTDRAFDYAGGFQRVLLELSDALPYTAFTPGNMD